MVLWELTLATAYWLGIRKTYRLALKLQRRLIGPKHPRIREFVHRRTRNVFDIALSVHKKIQGRDLESGKGVGNRVLRVLDRARPSAKIRGPSLYDKDNILHKKLSAGSAGDKGSTSMETKSVKSEMGSGKALFSQFVNKAPFTQSLINRIGGGFGRRWSGFPDTRSISGYKPCTTAGIGWEKSQFTIPMTWLEKSFEKGVFRSDIAHWMARERVRSTASF